MKYFLFLMVMLATTFTRAQTPNNNTLFSIGNENVTADEFVKVYLKNNPAKDADFSQKSLQDYLNLYVNFRLKVKEARDMKMDTLNSVLSELNTYRGQLAKNYLTDTTERNLLMDEAVDRMHTEIRVSHILIKCDPNACPEAVLKAQKRILAIKALLESGKDFATVARDSSADQSAKDNGGDLGYLTAMQVIYPFENCVYKTAVGQIDTVRTQFGYHLIKVTDRRAARGNIVVEHIFMKTGKSATDKDMGRAKIKIDSIYKLLQGGANFEDLAKKLSEDKTTSNEGGKLPAFSTGKMVMEFEDAAFGLQNPGDYSAPVKTKYGWHIIKLIQKSPIPGDKELKDQVKKQIDKDARSNKINQVYIQELKARYGFLEDAGAMQDMLGKLDSSFTKGNWKASNAGGLDRPIFTLSDKKFINQVKVFRESDLAQFLEANQHKVSSQCGKDMMFHKLYNQFTEASLLNFEDARLEKMYPKFADLMKEYMDGILLFDLTDQTVWSKAVKDTAGLRTFYATHNSGYLGMERAQVHVVRLLNSDTKLAYDKYAAKGKTYDWIAAKLNHKTPGCVASYNFIVEKGKNSEVEKLGWEAQKTYTVTSDSGIRYITITQMLPPVPKPLDEVRGYVVADYQDMLEKSWIDMLKQKYPVKVHEEVLQQLIKK